MEERAMSVVSGIRELSKETLAQFAAGAEEMETQICALEATIEKHKYERNNFKSKIEREIDSARRKFDTVKKEHDEAQYKAEMCVSYGTHKKWIKSLDKRSIGRKIGAFIGYFFLHIFLGSMLGVHISDIPLYNNSIGKQVDNPLKTAVLIGIVAWPTIFLLIRTIWRIYDYKDSKKIFKSKYDAAQEKLSEETANLAKANETYEENLLILAKMDEQITYLENSAIVLKNNLSVYYQKNIIPPDYRNLGCAVYINYVFRNDQADTMREATLICDKHLVHADQMKALKEIAVGIKGMANALSHIENTIDFIGQDIQRITETQEILISETKASRYATEALKSSAERLEWKVR